jgi:hypothetical protein
MNRLIEIFGAVPYKGERINLIWGQVKDLTDPWFETVITSFLCDFRHPPLIADFREKAILERDREWRIQKAENRDDAKQFFSFPPEEEREILNTIKKRMRGEVNDDDYGQFLNLLKETSRSDD